MAGRLLVLLYSCLLRLVHLLVSCAEQLARWTDAAVRRLRWSSGPEGPTLQQLRADARRLSKRPAHLGVLVVDSGFSWQTLADLVLWSMVYGVQYVSVYDRSGVVRSQAPRRLAPLLDAGRRRLLGGDAYTASVRLLADGQCDGAAEEVCNGAGPLYRVSVALLWEPDGRADVARAARQLCRQVAAGQRLPQSIHREMLGQHLSATRGWPDPQLAVRLGRVSSTLGYPPWQLQLTEVLQAPAHRPLLYSEYRHLLHTYSRIQQRCGA